MKVISYQVGDRRWSIFAIIAPSNKGNHYKHFCFELGSFLIDSDRDELNLRLSPVYVAHPKCMTARKEFMQDLQILYNMNPLWQRANIFA